MSVDKIVLTEKAWGDGFAQKIGEIILTLLKEGEYCSVRDDDCGIVVIEHDRDNKRDDCGGPYLEWLTDEELEAVEDFRFSKESDDVLYESDDVEHDVADEVETND